MAIDSDKDRVLIFDTTLRDGEQAPGYSMTREEKLQVARALVELRVDVIEAGFPASSRSDWESVQTIGREVHGPIICAMARCLREDIVLAAEALQDADRARLQVFVPSSSIHLQYKMRMAEAEIIRRAVEGICIAREFCEDVQFGLEDASRTHCEFLAQIAERAIEAGASTINLADTVGYAVPEEFSDLFRYLRKNVRGIDKVRLAAHCHNDLGMAVANSLAAVSGGARHIECTINGIGERAGNCSLEEVVMALRTRAEFFNVCTGIDPTHLYATSYLVANVTGVPIPRNKAVVGENAFSHESGIHQHAVLQHPSTYEILRPEDIGRPHSNLVLGKHSGRHALRERVKKLGFELDEFALNRVFKTFKTLAEGKKELSDSDIEALVVSENHSRVEGLRE